MYGAPGQHVHCRPLRSFSWTSNNARMSQLHRAGATIFQESLLDEGDEPLQRAAAAIWVQSAAEVGTQRLFLLDKNLTIRSKAETRILLWGHSVHNQRRVRERKVRRVNEITEDEVYVEKWQFWHHGVYLLCLLPIPVKTSCASLMNTNTHLVLRLSVRITGCMANWANVSYSWRQLAITLVICCSLLTLSMYRQVAYSYMLHLLIVICFLIFWSL